MGQRLNIEIWENDHCLANAYYHWSGYTDSAITLVNDIIEAFPHRKSRYGLAAAVELLRATGAELEYSELKSAGMSDELAKAFSANADRDRGLIAFTNKGIMDTRYWEEARVTVDMDRNTIDFNVFNPFDEDKNDPDYADVTIPYDHHCIDMHRFKDFAHCLGNVENKRFHFENGEVHSAIY